MNIKSIIIVYLIFKIIQIIYAVTVEEDLIEIVGFSVGLGVSLILAFFAFKDIAICKWLLTLTIFIGGLTTLLPGIFLVENDQLLLKVLAIVLGLYLTAGSYFLFIKTKNKKIFA